MSYYKGWAFEEENLKKKTLHIIVDFDLGTCLFCVEEKSEMECNKSIFFTSLKNFYYLSFLIFQVCVGSKMEKIRK